MNGLTRIYGLAGLRPGKEWADKVTCPPFDVIKPDTPLEALLSDNPDSLFHVILGNTPSETLARLIDRGVLIRDDEPGFYVYEQRYGSLRRTGFLAAPEVSPYDAKQIIRHEKTFDDKVNGRIKLMEDTGYVTEPIWLLTGTPVGELLDGICAGADPLYSFTSDFHGLSELSGIHNRIFKVAEDSPHGREIADIIAGEALYIADGHHRYHSALRMGLDRCIAYICQTDQARIQAYNRVIRSRIPFGTVMEKLPVKPAPDFTTPPRHTFAIYTREGCWQYSVDDVPEDNVIDRLDCSILEKTLYPHLGLRHDMIMDPLYFDYYPEQDISAMQKVVDDGAYDLAVALHPVSPDELMAAADAGIDNPDIVMPEKSTFFSPKILSGLILTPIA